MNQNTFPWSYFLPVITTLALAIFFAIFLGFRMAKNLDRRALSHNNIQQLLAIKAGKINTDLKIALETTRLLANEPLLQSWLQNQQEEESIPKLIQQRFTGQIKNHNYATIYLVSHHNQTYQNILSPATKQLSPENPNLYTFFVASILRKLL